MDHLAVYWTHMRHDQFRITEMVPNFLGWWLSIRSIAFNVAITLVHLSYATALPFNDLKVRRL